MYVRTVFRQTGNKPTPFAHRVPRIDFRRRLLIGPFVSLPSPADVENNGRRRHGRAFGEPFRNVKPKRYFTILSRGLLLSRVPGGERYRGPHLLVHIAVYQTGVELRARNAITVDFVAFFPANQRTGGRLRRIVYVRFTSVGTPGEIRRRENGACFPAPKFPFDETAFPAQS